MDSNIVFKKNDQEALDLKIKEGISKRPRYKNCYLPDLGDTEYVELPDTLVIRKRFDTFNRIYFLSDNAEELIGVLKELGTDDIINIPSKKELDESLVDTLNQGGYKLFQTFERYYNNHVEHRGDFTGEFAKESDAQQIYDLLYANFIPYTDHLPSMSEIHDRIKNQEIFVNRDKVSGKVIGLFSLTFEKQRCFFTLWINMSGDINESLSLYFNAFNLMHEKGYEKAYLWVREDNKFSKPIHLIHGFIFDGLKDYTFTKK